MKKLPKAQSKNESYAYNMGYDCGLNGANMTNCDSRIFSTPENTKEWERGKRDAESTKKSFLEIADYIEPLKTMKKKTLDVLAKELDIPRDIIADLRKGEEASVSNVSLVTIAEMMELYSSELIREKDEIEKRFRDFTDFHEQLLAERDKFETPQRIAELTKENQELKTDNEALVERCDHIAEDASDELKKTYAENAALKELLGRCKMAILAINGDTPQVEQLLKDIDALTK